MNEDEEQALLAATRALMAPLARLLVARGVPFASAEECLKVAMVEAARDAHPDGLPHRLVSRISTATGINRREVTRLTRADMPTTPQRSTVAEIFARWCSARAYRDAHGQPRTLPRQGDAPSFEALARSITQDVHPRSLLDELVRLGLATHDAGHDTVTLALADFVPAVDRARMLEFLANNVGDHLAAAVDNVLGPEPVHLERAVFAHGLSPQSIARAEAWVGVTWKRLVAELVPILESLIAQDDADPKREKNRRFRTGLYAFAEIDKASGAAPAVVAGKAAPAPRRRPAAPTKTRSKTAAPRAPAATTRKRGRS